MNIKRFIINKNEQSITIELSKGKTHCLSFEYLRVFPPNLEGPTQQKQLITNKKLVSITAIESVGKHGYRFIFDDQFSAIYPADYLMVLIKEQKQRWQHYLEEMKASGHSREAIINVTQLS